MRLLPLKTTRLLIHRGREILIIDLRYQTKDRLCQNQTWDDCLLIVIKSFTFFI